MKFIIFDTETNGFNHCSVLSISAIKAELKGDKLVEIDRYDRYYYRHPEERRVQKAFEIHNLNSEKIEELRGDVKYPELFLQDVNSFFKFCKDSDGFIAHKIVFDKKFIPFKLWNEICTLEISKEVYTLPNNKLSDLANYLGVGYSEESLHGSMYDVEVLFEVVNKMIKDKNIKKEFFDIKVSNITKINDFKYEFNGEVRKPKPKKIKNIFKGITEEQISRVELSYDEVSISLLIKSVNKVLEEGSKLSSASKLNDVLCEHGILEKKDKKSFAHPNSEKLGIYNVEKIRENGDKYTQVIYNKDGQQHILNNLNKYFIQK